MSAILVLAVIVASLVVVAYVVASAWLETSIAAARFRAAYRLACGTALFARTLGDTLRDAAVYAAKRDTAAALRTVRVGLPRQRHWRRAAPHASDALKTRAEKPNGTRRVGRVTSARATPSGERIVVVLPRGIHADTVNHNAIASAYSATSAVVEKGRTARHAELRIRRRDTLSAPIAYPGPSTAPWTPKVTIGVDEDGGLVTLDLGAAHLVVGGASRSGKSNTLHLLISRWAENQDSLLWLWDGKGGAELGAWRTRAHAFHDGEGVGAHLAEALRDEINRRFDRLVASGRVNAAGDFAEYPPVLVVVDEVAAYAAQGKDALRFLQVLRDAMMRGLAVNVTVVLATQKATGDAVPSALSALAEARLAFKCGTPQMAAAILGHEHAEYAYRDLPSPASGDGLARTAGRFVVAEASRVVFGRAYQADPDALARGAASASAARPPFTPEGVRAGTPPRAGTRPRARATPSSWSGRSSTSTSSARTTPTTTPLPTRSRGSWTRLVSSTLRVEWTARPRRRIGGAARGRLAVPASRSAPRGRVVALRRDASGARRSRGEAAPHPRPRRRDVRVVRRVRRVPRRARRPTRRPRLAAPLPRAHAERDVATPPRPHDPPCRRVVRSPRLLVLAQPRRPPPHVPADGVGPVARARRDLPAVPRDDAWAHHPTRRASSAAERVRPVGAIRRGVRRTMRA